MKEGSAGKEVEDHIVYKCMSVKRSITDLLFRSDIDRPLVARMIEDFNFGLLLADDREDRKLGLIYGSFLLTLLFKSSSALCDSQLPTYPEPTLHLAGPFSRTGALVFLNFDKRAFEQSHRSIQLKTLSPYHKDIKQQHIIFNYVLTSLSGDRSMLIGVSIDRVLDILSKPQLLDCIPDPRDTCVYFNTRQGNRIQSEDIAFEHLDYTAWTRKYFSGRASAELRSTPFLKGDSGLNLHFWGDPKHGFQKHLDLSTIEAAPTSPLTGLSKAGAQVFFDAFKLRPKTLQEIPSTFPKALFLNVDSANPQAGTSSAVHVSSLSTKRKAGSCTKPSHRPLVNARDRLPNTTYNKQQTSRQESPEARTRRSPHKTHTEAYSSDSTTTSQQYISKRYDTRSVGRRLLSRTESPVALKANAMGSFSSANLSSSAYKLGSKTSYSTEYATMPC